MKHCKGLGFGCKQWVHPFSQTLLLGRQRRVQDSGYNIYPRAHFEGLLLPGRQSSPGHKRGRSLSHPGRQVDAEVAV